MGKMKKYVVEVSRGYTYRVPVEAKDEYEAREIVREMSNDLIEDFEVTAFWDFEIGEEVAE
jgi:phosphoribosylformylglycinamidine (FGAM) synthase PurS component